MEDYILHICPTINKNIKRFHNDKLYLRKDAIPKYILVSQIVCLGQIIIVILKAMLLFKGKCIPGQSQQLMQEQSKHLLEPTSFHSEPQV